MSNFRTSIACFSVATLHYYPQRDSCHAGGNSLNQAVAFGRSGFACSYVGALGTDIAGDKIISLLSDSSVDTTHTYRFEGETARNQIINDESGERYGVDGARHGSVYESFKLGRADWDYLKDFDIWASHADCASLIEGLTYKTARQFLTVDFLHLKDYRLLRKARVTIDIAYFGREVDMADDLSQIAEEIGTVIVLTLGKSGSMAFHNGQVYNQPALEIEKEIDTTGCGDAFQAAFTAEYYVSGDIAAALLFGAESGSVTAEHFGGN